MSRPAELDDRSMHDRGSDRRNPATLRELSYSTARGHLAGRSFGGIAMLIALVVATVTGRAEIRWMEPETPAVTPGAAIWVGMTKADEFGASGEALSVANAGGVVASLAGQPLVVTSAGGSGGMMRFNVTLPRPGVALLVSDLPVEHRTIQSGEVERYLRAMYATDDVRAQWARFPAGSPWREALRQRLKTFVRVGQPVGDERSWFTAKADGLDLTPLSDPTACRENQEVAVAVTDGGHPLVGCIVSFLSAGETREHVEVTDAEGRAAAPLDARGAWLIRAIRIQPAAGSDNDWATDVVGATVYVR